MTAKRKVIQWATGGVGLHGLRALVEHPDLELVGLVVHDPTKAGRDAGDFFGGPPTGVVATTDIDGVLKLEADAVSYMATGDIRMTEAIDDMCAALAGGKNVVASAVVPLVYPAAFPPDLVARLDNACPVPGADRRIAHHPLRPRTRPRPRPRPGRRSRHRVSTHQRHCSRVQRPAGLTGCRRPTTNCRPRTPVRPAPGVRASCANDVMCGGRI